MTAKSIYRRYTPRQHSPTEQTEAAWMFVFHAETGKLLIKEQETHVAIPRKEDLASLELAVVSKRYLGEVDGEPCYCLEVAEGIQEGGLQFKELRSLLGMMEEDIFLLAGRAFQIMNWNRMHRYCGRCGSETITQPGELAKKCNQCNAVFYPRLSPAVIVAVVRGREILLAHNKNFRPNWHSVIAGFVEPGETFEDCVKREVREEVGIRVKNVRYFGSQPWPFPDSLMIGFIAEYDSGDIRVDGIEIDSAGWYHSENLPPHPEGTSIAGRLIAAVLKEE